MEFLTTLYNRTKTAPRPYINDQLFEYKQQKSYIQRVDESCRIKKKYPNRIPIYCQVFASSNADLSLDKCKYLVPGDLTVGQFLFVLRRRIALNPEKALFIFDASGAMPATAEMLSQLYQNKCDDDGFLYLLISLESTFG